MQKLMKAMHKNEKGFTLVELMVVVVIIGILIAIAIPLYGGLQERARENAHAANMRTLRGQAAIHVSEGLGADTWREAADTAFIDTWPVNPWATVSGHVNEASVYEVLITTNGVITLTFGDQTEIVDPEGGGGG